MHMSYIRLINVEHGTFLVFSWSLVIRLLNLQP